MNGYKMIVSRLSHLTDRLAISANILGALLVLLIVVVINTDVFMRTIFIAPIRGVVEIVEISIVAIVFLQLPDLVRIGRLTRSDAFLEGMTSYRPAVGHTLRRAFDLLSAGFMGLVIYAIAPTVIEDYEEGAYVGTEGVFTAPEWPLKLIIVVGASLCLARWLLNAISPKGPQSPGGFVAAGPPIGAQKIQPNAAENSNDGD